MGDQPEVLALAGLTENEARVAQALLELGSCGAGEVIKRTGLHRELVYSALDRLAHKGLASVAIRNNVKEFRVDRAKLARLLQERIEGIQALIPSMLAPAERPPEVRVFDGEKGLRLLAAELKNEEEILFLGSCPLAEKLAERLPVKKKILWEKRVGVKQSRLAPKNLVLPIPLAVSGSKTILFPHSELALVLESAELAASHRSLFQALWRSAKE